MLHAFGPSPFAAWLASTSLSRLFQDVLWIIPVSQFIHIVCISILFASAIAINLRLLGWRFLDRHVASSRAACCHGCRAVRGRDQRLGTAGG